MQMFYLAEFCRKMLLTINHYSFISGCCKPVHIFPLYISLYMNIKIQRCLYGSVAQDFGEGLCVKTLFYPAAGELMAKGMYFYVWYLTFFQKSCISSLHCARLRTVLRSCQKKETSVLLQRFSHRLQAVGKRDLPYGG